MKGAAIYLRVSTSGKSKHGDTQTFDQDPAVQERPLRDLIEQRGWTLADTSRAVQKPRSIRAGIACGNAAYRRERSISVAPRSLSGGEPEVSHER